MRFRLKSLLAGVFVFVPCCAFSGTLSSEWTKNSSRYCHYSNGEIIVIDISAKCMNTNLMINSLA